MQCGPNCANSGSSTTWAHIGEMVVMRSAVANCSSRRMLGAISRLPGTYNDPVGSMKSTYVSTSTKIESTSHTAIMSRPALQEICHPRRRRAQAGSVQQFASKCPPCVQRARFDNAAREWRLLSASGWLFRRNITAHAGVGRVSPVAVSKRVPACIRLLAQTHAAFRDAPV